MAVIFDSWLVEFGAVIVAFLAGIYIYMTLKFQYWKKKGVPYLEPSFPFGNVSDMALQRKSIGHSFCSLYWKLDGHRFAGIYQLQRPTLLVRDPEVVKMVFVKDFASFHDRGIFFDEKIDPLTAHLLFLEGTRWKHLRYKLAPTFTSGKMKMMFPTLVECGKELGEYLAPMASRKDTIEVKDIMAKYTTDVIASCAFGIESNCLKNPDSEFRKMGRKAIESSILENVRDVLAFAVPKLVDMLKLPSIPRDVTKFFLGIVRETLEYREKNQVSRNDFMQLMIGIKNKKTDQDTGEVKVDDERNMYDVNGMTTEEVAAQAFVFFIAGFETSSTTMSFCLYELALNQGVQDRLREEVDTVLAEHGGAMTYEALSKMEYMDRVVAETLRKYPPIAMILRSCTKEYQLPGTEAKLEVGTPVVIPVQALHYDPQYYPNPDEFDPERFTEEAKSQRHQYVYLPFGEGPRMCIGSRFGLMQTKVGLASVISKYTLSVCTKLTPIPIVYDTTSFVTSAKGGINLKITERTKA